MNDTTVKARATDLPAVVAERARRVYGSPEAMVRRSRFGGFSLSAWAFPDSDGVVVRHADINLHDAGLVSAGGDDGRVWVVTRHSDGDDRTNLSVYMDVAEARHLRDLLDGAIDRAEREVAA